MSRSIKTESLRSIILPNRNHNRVKYYRLSLDSIANTRVPTEDFSSVKKFPFITHCHVQSEQNIQIEKICETKKQQVQYYQESFIKFYQNDELMKQMLRLELFGKSLPKLLDELEEQIQYLSQNKNNSYIKSLINKFETLNFLFKDSEPRDWNSGHFFRRIFFYNVKLSNKKLKLKVKHQLDLSLLQQIQSLIWYLEKITVKICQKTFKLFQASLLKSKENLINKKNQYFFQLKGKNRETDIGNFRKVINDQIDFTQIHQDPFSTAIEVEKKLGKFDHIQQLTRSTCLGINKVVESLFQSHFI